MDVFASRPKRLVAGFPLIIVLCILLSVFSSLSASASTTQLPVVRQYGLIRGVQSESDSDYPGIPWVRLGYPTCGWGNLSGATLKNTIDAYHSQGIRVLLTVCQGINDSHLFDTAPLNDAALGGPDAVQCGNEEMKINDPSVSFLYIPPDRFARFYALCEAAMHAVRSDIPVLLGSLDPHVGNVDYGPMGQQVQYLNQMQAAMNTTVHPGGAWNWHNATLGLIDTWHNDFPDSSYNNLYWLFRYWANQFHVNLGSGALGRHIWVVEGTACFVGCGIDANSPYQVAVAHILDLISNVLTADQYNIPYFHFSGKDFYSVGHVWPIGVRDINGNDKPLRQDLPMGARTLTLNCSSTSVVVETQEDLLSKLYAHCSLPPNYVSILEA